MADFCRNGCVDCLQVLLGVCCGVWLQEYCGSAAAIKCIASERTVCSCNKLPVITVLCCSLLYRNYLFRLDLNNMSLIQVGSRIMLSPTSLAIPSSCLCWLPLTYLTSKCWSAPAESSHSFSSLPTLIP